MRKGEFDLDDLRDQLKQMAEASAASRMMGMLPGIGKIKKQIEAAGLDDGILKRQRAIIESMTPKERASPKILTASGKKRIAAGSGTRASRTSTSCSRCTGSMADMMKAMGSGKRGPLAGIAQAMGFGGGMKQPSPEEMKALAEKMQGGAGGLPNLPNDLPVGLRQGLPNLPGLTGLSGKPMLPGLGGFPGKKK